jgi:hypothetical protein
VNLIAFRRGNSGTFLAAMLQREQPEKCCAGYAFAGYVYTDNAALFVRLIVGIYIDRAWGVYHRC